VSAGYSRLPADLPVPVDGAAAEPAEFAAREPKVFHPAFSPEHAGEVLAWLSGYATEQEAGR
jgi:hypothetical protein